MKVPFNYWLHDDYTRGEFRDEILVNNLHLDAMMSEEELDELMEKIGRPFYEVTLECELDTETGQITLLQFRL